MNEPEPRRAPLHDDPDGEVDADFLYHLYRGGELLAGGKNFEARDELERANHLKPLDEKGQNLLGLVYFKLGLLDRAIEIYGRLVQDNPGDATLRTNLGLVYLKAGQISQAIAQLEAALEVLPDHFKALNYLGLAYAQAHDHRRAREAFERAGNETMTRKIDQARRADDTKPESKHVSFEPAEPKEPRAVPPPAERSRPDPVTEPTAAQPLGLTELVRRAAYTPPPASPFQVDEVGVTLRLDGQLRSRLSGLLWVRGDIQNQAEQKRFRGRATDKAFGEGPDRVFRLSGNGEILLATQGKTFTALELGDEAAYLVEDVLFSFEESLWYENGRVPSKTPPDLNLIHLRGRGKALLRSAGPPRSIEVRKGEPVQLPLERLVGWVGQLTPTLLIPESHETTGQPTLSRSLRLEGEGWALWAQPVGT